ncbi:unnamed protein product [Brachionus calyciflorus]|uniref:EF-hand domain-containing protein n=1 Tax=Brachionus calyciflorus TaxID=104777 RepID=A0A813QK83_9BILA|nr:unnamed protein product [Brachionus calyciflorus]
MSTESQAVTMKKIHIEPIPIHKPKVQDLLVEVADEASLRAIFDKYATHTVLNQKAIKSEDFIQKYLGLLSEKDSNEKTLKILANLADLNKDGYITFDEFKIFEELLCSPDVLFKTAFQLFDIRGVGLISFTDFKEIISHTTLNQLIPFDFESNFVNNLFGQDRQRQINYQEFSQIIHDFHEEHAMQAFNKFDIQKKGYILPSNFKTILLQMKSNLLSPYVRENLDALITRSTDQNTITYPHFVAFIYLLNNMELIKKIYLTIADEHPNREVSKGQFLKEAQQFSQVTPYEINILFSLIRSFRDDDKITLKDLEKIAPLEEKRMPYRVSAKLAEETQIFQNRNIGIQMLESGYRFFLGSIAGAIGAFAVYPIDLVKTRMQNQRSKSYVGEVMYRNSWDCFKKVIRHEGVLGLYKGLTVQLIGVAPEKAIKLTVNDFVRDKFMQYTGELPLYAEIIAGGMAGGCQVIFTNPMEIVKIRMQVAGEIQSQARSERTLKIVKELGFVGLYKGVRACLLRDIPFSMIYFPSYSHMKKTLSDENGHNSPMSLFYAGLIAGVPAAGLCTPADVIKTRIQVRERQGQTQYKGVIDAMFKIYKEEGPRAFWKGTGARVFRSSPQFGVTLLSYELLQRMFWVDFGGRKPEGSQIDITKDLKTNITSLNPEHIGGFKLATVTFAGIENKFGLCFPRFNKVQ